MKWFKRFIEQFLLVTKNTQCGCGAALKSQTKECERIEEEKVTNTE